MLTENEDKMFDEEIHKLEHMIKWGLRNYHYRGYCDCLKDLNITLTPEVARRIDLRYKDILKEANK